MISKEQIEHIARLARIELSEQEKEKFAKELSSILDYVEKLNKVDVSKVESISQVTGPENVTREDDPKSRIQNLRSKLLNQAPQKKDNYIKVPKILE